MGSYDGAKVCDLEGLYILSQLQNLNLNIGLYRDDSLAVGPQTPQQLDHVRTEICRIFKENKLKITIHANMKRVDFLDVTIDLESGLFKPNMKPNVLQLLT